MIIVEDFDDIKRAMEIPEDLKAIEPEDWIYEESRQEMRFGDEHIR